MPDELVRRGRVDAKNTASLSRLKRVLPDLPDAELIEFASKMAEIESRYIARAARTGVRDQDE